MNAVKIIENAKYSLGNYIISLDEYERIVEPLKDVEPIKHGHWTRVDYYPVGHDYICSICDRKHSGSFNFCPDCGAKMDEIVSNDA